VRGEGGGEKGRFVDSVKETMLMNRRRLQFSLRSMFVLTTIFVVLCALVKCEVDARRTFSETSDTVRSVLAKVVPEVERELYDRWLRDARANPTFSSLEKELLRPDVFVGRYGSSETNFSGLYFERHPIVGVSFGRHPPRTPTSHSVLLSRKRWTA
jgi:hypothetical protein